MDRISKLRRNQQGIVSFLAVMFITILLTIIVLSLLRVMLNEQRVATDFDQSAKAYYAAEAGVEDAIAEIQDAVDNTGDAANAVQQTCSPEKVIATGSDEIEYTCQLISISPLVTEGEIKKDSTAQINLDTVGDQFDNISFWWHLKGEDFQEGQPINPPSNLPQTIDGSGNYDGSSWGAAPAYMKVNIVSYPDGGSFNRGEILSHVFYLLPDESGSDVSIISAQDEPLGSGHNDNSTAPTVMTQCNPALSDYACQMTIDGMDNDSQNYVVILKPFYADANYKLEARNGTNSVQISGNEVVIDVTGRAGDVFRRVVAKIPLRSNTFGQDYVLLTDDILCKDFDVTREDPPETNEFGSPQSDGCVTY